MELDMLNKMLEMKKAMDNNGGDSILEMLELLKEKNRSVKSKTEELEKRVPEQSIDFIDDVAPPGVKAIKSCIPYLEEKYQRNVALFIKCIELQNLMDKYKSVSTETRKKNDENWKKAMILAVKSHMGDDQKQKADMLVQIMELQDILKLVKNIDNKKGDKDE